MKMKRIKLAALSLACLMMVSALAGCAKPQEPAAVKTPEELTTAYQTAIEGARTEDDNTYNKLITNNEEDAAELAFQLLGITAEDVTAYAIGVSMMNVQAYGVAAIMPAADKSEAVLKGVNAFVAQQQQNFAQYLQDQYEIAKAAKVETLDDGTILLIMCADQDTVLAAVKDALSK